MSATSTTTYLSPSCQEIVYQDLDQLSQGKIAIRSCMADPKLSPALTNHKCNNVVLTPSGLYVDMALTVAEHIWKHYRGPTAELPGFNVSDVEVHKPLIVKDVNKMEDLWLEMETTTSIRPVSRGDIVDAVLKCVFYTIKADGTRIQENGHCSVQYEWYFGWLSSWSSQASSIQSRINNLYSRVSDDASASVQLIHRAKVYQLFKSFVDYTDKYQNMSEVVYDSDALEATALLTFVPDPATDHCGPFYLDGSCHLSGFLANAVERDKDKNAFISNGVTSMKLSPRFKPEAKGAKIQTYVQMAPLPNDKSVLSGDVYVLQEGEIVGLWEGVKFKKIPRRVLNVFLPPPKK